MYISKQKFESVGGAGMVGNHILMFIGDPVETISTFGQSQHYILPTYTASDISHKH